MPRKNYLDTDLNGQPIDQKSKDSKSVEIDGNSRFAGHRFLLKTKLFGDKRCIYCGKWFHWKDTDSQTWMNEGNICNTNNDNVIEPLHCGSNHCREYHHLWLVELERRKKFASERMSWQLFKDLQNKGAIA